MGKNVFIQLFSYFLHECLQDNKYIIKLGW